MTLTTSYSLTSLLGLDLSVGPSTIATDVVALAGGGFVGVGSFSGHTAIDSFDAGGVHVGGYSSLNGVGTAVVELGSGDLLITSIVDGVGIYTTRTLQGGVISPENEAFRPNTGDVVSIDAASLGGDDFLIAMSPSSGFEVVVVRVINDVRHTSFVNVGDLLVGTDASVSSIGNGSAVIAYALESSPISALKLGIWLRDEIAMGGTFIVDQRGSINRNPSVVDTPGAGFGIAYETDSQSDSIDIVFSLFSEQGTRLATFDISNPTFASQRSDETNATASMLTDTLVAITYTARSTATRDQPPVSKVALFDLTTNTTVARLSISSLSLISSIGPQIAGLDNGLLAFFATNTTNSNDGFGRLLGATRTQISDASNDLMIGDEVRDVMLGGDGNDTLTGGPGAADDLHGGLGADRFRFGDGQIAAGTVIAGDGGADRIEVTGLAELGLATITSIEKLVFAASGNLSVVLAGAQFGAGQVSGALQVTGQTGNNNRILIDMGADTALDLSRLAFSTWQDSGPGADSIVVTGDEAAEDVRGSAAGDVIDLGGGADTLNGGLGRDVLKGGGGADRFVFSTTLGAGNVDTVNGFASGQDQIRLDDAIFIGLSRGKLAGSAFQEGTEANSAKDRIIYDAVTGALFFDADGTGAAEQQRFATLDANTVLQASDIFVF